jgi:hypothetical protein
MSILENSLVQGRPRGSRTFFTSTSRLSARALSSASSDSGDFLGIFGDIEG